MLFGGFFGFKHTEGNTPFQRALILNHKVIADTDTFQFADFFICAFLTALRRDIHHVGRGFADIHTGLTVAQTERA